MKRILTILLLFPLMLSAQLKVSELTTTTTFVGGDYLIKNDSAGGSGGTKKITIDNLFTSQTLTSPVLVTPELGVPTSGTLTNTTGLPLESGVTGTLPVANGGTGVTTSTGTTNVVLSNSPTLVTPNLGTPSTLVGTNITGTALGFTAGTYTAPISATSNTISISQSATGADGYLSSTDWNTFNNKQATVSANAPLSITTNTVTIDTTSANGVTTKFYVDSLAGTITAPNIYSADGTLTGDRTVTQGTNILTFNSTNTTAAGAVTINRTGANGQCLTLNKLGANSGYAMSVTTDNTASAGIKVTSTVDNANSLFLANSLGTIAISGVYSGVNTFTFGGGTGYRALNVAHVGATVSGTLKTNMNISDAAGIYGMGLGYDSGGGSLIWARSNRMTVADLTGWGMNCTPSASTMFQVKGSGSTSATINQLNQNSSGTLLWQLKDDGSQDWYLPGNNTTNIIRVDGDNFLSYNPEAFYSVGLGTNHSISPTSYAQTVIGGNSTTLSGSTVLLGYNNAVAVSCSNIIGIGNVNSFLTGYSGVTRIGNGVANQSWNGTNSIHLGTFSGAPVAALNADSLLQIYFGGRTPSLVGTGRGQFGLIEDPADSKNYIYDNTSKATQLGTGGNTLVIGNHQSIPTTNLTDKFQLYSKDIIAGNASPHFRTENGDIIKLFSNDNTITPATLTGGGGTTITDTDTFGGFTLQEVVAALIANGLLK